MKKSNIFFGATAFALAIAGAFASKASTKVLTIQAYTGVSCTHSKLVSCTSDIANPCKKLVSGLSGLQTLYTRFTRSDNTFICTNQLYTTN